MIYAMQYELRPTPQSQDFAEIGGAIATSFVRADDADAALAIALAYYRDSGAITGNNTFTQLQHHLEQSLTAGDSQLQAFVNQTRGKAPRFITQAAADALVAEAERLLQG